MAGSGDLQPVQQVVRGSAMDFCLLVTQRRHVDDTDLVAGKTQEITVTPQATGTFNAICHHFCGAGHGNMKLTVVVE